MGIFSDDSGKAAPAAASSFPAGLNQPAGCARFGLDALLLGCFAAQIYKAKKPAPVLDLGCGCGAALFAFLLSAPYSAGIGIEREKALLQAAQDNARVLELQRRTQFLQADLAISRPHAISPYLGRAGLIMANPPWHEPHSGRMAPEPLKARAHMAPANDFFCAAASRLLRHRGLFTVIIPANLLGQFHMACHSAHLGLRRILPVVTKPGKGPLRLLLLAQKNASDDIVFLPQLQLRETGGNYADAARSFCPWLYSIHI